MLRFPSSVVFKTLTNTNLHNSKVYPLHFASELKVRNNKHHCPLSPLMWASCWLSWPSFPAIPPSVLMPRFKENMGNGYKNTSNLQSNIYQINYPICTQAKHLKSKVKDLTYTTNIHWYTGKLHPPAILLAGTKCIYLIGLPPKDIISY